MFEQARFHILRRLVGPDVQAARRLVDRGQLYRRHSSNLDFAACFDHVCSELECDPAPAEAAHRDAVQTVVENLLHV